MAIDGLSDVAARGGVPDEAPTILWYPRFRYRSAGGSFVNAHGSVEANRIAKPAINGENAR